MTKKMIRLDDLKKIRRLTGASIDSIRAALEAAGGEASRALEFLKKRGEAAAVKKSERATGQGLIFSYVHATGKIGVLLKLLCETDFVARNDEFKYLGQEIAMQIAAMDPRDKDELLSQTYIRDNNLAVKDLLADYIAKLGENIRVDEFCRFEI